MRLNTNTKSLVICIVVVFVTVSLLNLEAFNEHIEHKWIKDGSQFHNLMHTSKHRIKVPAQEALIVYVHVPRTSGLTLKISLFNDVAYHFMPMRMDYFVGKEQDWTPNFNNSNDETMGPARPWPIGLVWPEHRVRRPWKMGWQRQGTQDIQKAIEKGNVIQGLFSKQDIQRLRKMANGRPIKLWTVLRDPIERSLSLKSLVGNHRIPWPVNKSAAKFSDFYAQPTPNVGRGELKPHVQDYVQSYCHNGMTWQLGHQMHAAFRNITEEEVLASAKSFLEEMDYVGFFEDMTLDFPRLVQTIFPHSENALMYKLSYWMGTIMGWPRMHVRKFLNKVPIDQREAVYKANQLDIQLYDWAKKRYHKDHLLMFDTYAECTQFMLVALATVLVGVVGCCCVLCRMKRRCLDQGRGVSGTLHPTQMGVGAATLDDDALEKQVRRVVP